MTPTGLEQVQTTAVFDYSQLDEQTAQTLKNYSFRALQVARTYYRDLMEIVVGAHKLLCGVVPAGDNSLHGNRGEDTFRAWCASVHISKTKAYQLLQIQDFMDSCTPEQQSTLALLPFTAMRELVTSDTPEQVITMAKEGKVGTSKEVLELKAQLKAEQDRADAAEAREEEAWNMVSKAQEETKNAKNDLEVAIVDLNGLTEQNAKLQQSYHDADESRIAANLQRQKAEAERDKAEARAKDAENQLAGSRQVAEAAKLRGDKLKAENDALKHQPITAVVDKEETRRQAKEMADAMNAELQAKLDAVTGDAEQDVRNAYDSVLLASRAMLNTWQMVKPQFCKLPKAQRETLANQIVSINGQINGEVAQCL